MVTLKETGYFWWYLKVNLIQSLLDIFFRKIQNSYECLPHLSHGGGKVLLTQVKRTTDEQNTIKLCILSNNLK